MRPFVKWVGGKAQLLDKIKELMPSEYNHYYEPFVGGGALLFNIAPKDFTINDFNSELITTYRCFTDKHTVDKLIEKLNEYQNNHSEEQYYKIRAMDRDPGYADLADYEKAARMIYLNKSCFNGLYRVNGSGYFSTPSGKKKTVNCYDKENLDEIVNYFTTANAEIMNGDFADAVANAKAGDFVYLDPPYDTWEDKNSFVSYTKNSFGKDEQKRVADTFKALADKGAYVMLSNHNTAYIQELYAGYDIHVVDARRSINSKGTGRGNVEEVLITSYATDAKKKDGKSF